ncbi:MAG: type II toxin-antitoxin system VapB family antitoxin [Proteobacteria bacterium]|nr:type II toxin-antitoxin system VapB family antitoxin [Pseudomonadota bacterium]
MRTNIVIEEELIKKALEYTGLKTKKEVVNFALRELIQRKERKEILRFKGKLRWEGDLEEMRRSRFNDTD